MLYRGQVFRSAKTGGDGGGRTILFIFNGFLPIQQRKELHQVIRTGIGDVVGVGSHAATVLDHFTARTSATWENSVDIPSAPE